MDRKSPRRIHSEVALVTKLGVVERDRKLQIPAFVWAFVFGFAAGESRTLAGFRRCYNSTADETISPGGFY
ncbi:hypothetical protein PNP59_13515, partial [Halobacterium salinarum]|nr:hypothetical protein [Halobacterium salinarum]